MMAGVLGVEATRAELRGELVKAEAAAQKAAEVAIAAALHAELGDVTRCELEAAESAYIAAGARLTELRGAFDAFGEREANRTAAAVE
jgi:hypothetical protein